MGKGKAVESAHKKRSVGRPVCPRVRTMTEKGRLKVNHRCGPMLKCPRNRETPGKGKTGCDREPSQRKLLCAAERSESGGKKRVKRGTRFAVISQGVGVIVGGWQTLSNGVPIRKRQTPQMHGELGVIQPGHCGNQPQEKEQTNQADGG